MKKPLTIFLIGVSTVLTALVAASAMGTMLLIVETEAKEDRLVQVIHNRKPRRLKRWPNSFYYTLLFANSEQLPRVLVHNNYGRITCDTKYQTFPQAHLVILKIDGGLCKKKAYSFPVG